MIVTHDRVAVILESMKLFPYAAGNFVSYLIY